MVFCFGELLLRLSPESGDAWITKNLMPVFTGGAELNVASALAKWKIPVRYGSALPINYLTRQIVEKIKLKGIDPSAVYFTGNRIGIYYLQQGGEIKDTALIYDRAHSSFAELKPGMINWEEALKDCSWFHFSAISPALNEEVVAVCKEALQVASSKGLIISIDLNYRPKLWQYGKQAVAIMPQLLQYCTVVMGNIWAVESLLGINSSIKESKGKTNGELIAAAGESMKQIHLTYPTVTTIAYTFRLEQTYFGILQHGQVRVISKEFPLENIVDKVGSGDCFMGGLICGLYNQDHPQDIIDFAAAAAVGKMKEKGDATNQTIESIKYILNSNDPVKL